LGGIDTRQAVARAPARVALDYVSLASLSPRSYVELSEYVARAEPPQRANSKVMRLDIQRSRPIAHPRSGANPATRRAKAEENDMLLPAWAASPERSLQPPPPPARASRRLGVAVRDRVHGDGVGLLYPRRRANGRPGRSARQLPVRRRACRGCGSTRIRSRKACSTRAGRSRPVRRGAPVQYMRPARHRR